MTYDTKRALHKQPPPPSIRQPLLQLCFVVVATVILVFALQSSPVERPSSLLAFRPPDSCHIIGTNPAAYDLWQFTTRSLCLSSHVCFNTSNPSSAIFHASNLTATKCHVDTHDFRQTERSLPAVVGEKWMECNEFQHSLVHCAHGTGLKDDAMVCPMVRPLFPTMQQEGFWVEDISVIVPDFPYTYNIYHYASLATDLVRTIENLKGLIKRWGTQNVQNAEGQRLWPREIKLRKVNVFLQSDPAITRQHTWKKELLEMMLRERVEQKGIGVTLTFMKELKRAGFICMRNAVILGRRGHVNLWPFINGTNAPEDGLSVAKDAVQFKRTVYKATRVGGKLPGEGDAHPPPFVVGYARRVGKKGEDGFYRSGNVRRFSEKDEKWFEAMLKNETEKAGAKLVTLEFTKEESLGMQVRRVVDVGFIVGIHGANLVNSIFMRPFGALMEIMPRYLGARCYIAGANSGLKYLKFEATEMASPEESGCDPMDYECKNEIRQRMIKWGEGDKEKVIEMVREGIRHLKQVREQFPEGIRTRFDEDSVYYQVEGIK